MLVDRVRQQQRIEHSRHGRIDQQTRRRVLVVERIDVIRLFGVQHAEVVRHAAVDAWYGAAVGFFRFQLVGGVLVTERYGLYRPAPSQHQHRQHHCLNFHTANPSPEKTQSTLNVQK